MFSIFKVELFLYFNCIYYLKKKKDSNVFDVLSRPVPPGLLYVQKGRRAPTLAGWLLPFFSFNQVNNCFYQFRHFCILSI